MNRDSDKFVTLLTSSQVSLYACILALLPDRAAARDVLQETNLTLWRKAVDFEEGTNFLGWAARIAHYHVLNHRRKRGRDRLVFDDSLFEQLAERQVARVESFDRREGALRGCLEKLPPDQRALIERRYAPGGSVQALAAAAGKSVGAISQTLYRIREALLNCIHASLIPES
jgi:RNA polymerase sigma-70 factor, ECF subfamily